MTVPAVESHKVTLTVPELMVAWHVHNMRMARVVKHGIKPRYGAPDSDKGGVSIGTLGCEGECAWAKASNQFWVGEPNPRDVGMQEVRTVTDPAHKLILHHHDPDDVPFVLVEKVTPQGFRMIGWLLGAEGKQERYWQTHTGRPCFMVPRTMLHPIPTCQVATVHQLGVV